MSEIKTIEAAEFLRQSGLLFQINRDILHPLGLAMAIDIDEDKSTLSNALWDYRDDPAGITYAPETLISGEQKIRKFYAEFGTEKIKERFDTIGYITQQICEVEYEEEVEIKSDFSTALAWLRAGKKVARTDWPKGKYLRHATSAPGYHKDENGTIFETFSYIEMISPDTDEIISWGPIGFDMFDTEWTIIK